MKQFVARASALETLQHGVFNISMHAQVGALQFSMLCEPLEHLPLPPPFWDDALVSGHTKALGSILGTMAYSLTAGLYFISFLSSDERHTSSATKLYCR